MHKQSGKKRKKSRGQGSVEAPPIAPVDPRQVRLFPTELGERDDVPESFDPGTSGGAW